MPDRVGAAGLPGLVPVAQRGELEACGCNTVRYASDHPSVRLGKLSEVSLVRGDIVACLLRSRWARDLNHNLAASFLKQDGLDLVCCGSL